VEVDAFAKINLFLAVIGKREDGYHELVSVMQKIGLRDRLTIAKAQHNTSGTLVTLKTDAPNLPTNDTNLVVKAANLLIKEYGIATPLAINLTKRIPTGAGLGGGSSDCAATLLGINQLLGLQVPLDKLMELGATLGADVPFCVMANSCNTTALAQGIGEKLTPLPPHPKCHVVLACPKIHVSTGEIFKVLTLCGLTGINIQAKLDNFMAAYNSKDILQISKNFYNTFTPITSKIHPQISSLISDLQNHGAYNAAMTGTGSTVFAYFENENKAKMVCEILEKTHTNTKFCHTEI